MDNNINKRIGIFDLDYSMWCPYPLASIQISREAISVTALGFIRYNICKDMVIEMKRAKSSLVFEGGLYIKYKNDSTRMMIIWIARIGRTIREMAGMGYTISDGIYSLGYWRAHGIGD